MPTTDLSLPLPNGRSLTAAVAVPDGPGPHPGVLVLHEAFGLNGDIRRITSRFADEGYVALAPDLYSGGNRLRCLSALLLGPHQKESLALVEVARLALAGRADVDERRIAVIGFCMGGGFALAFGARGGVRAASVNYGAVDKDREKYADVCPVVAGYGAKDKMFTKQAVRLEEHLEALGVPHDVKIYENVGHSFMSYDNGPAWMLKVPNPLHAGYSEPEAEDNWKRILAFFGEHVRA
ncbi:MAG: carboxymethylenebutenolidase [Actinomycetota bacterium]|jgi:carboxymethylenebutenolidase|nr:carboxymethylenebutenolidase [Actinomycetota bacterium]